MAQSKIVDLPSFLHGDFQFLDGDGMIPSRDPDDIGIQISGFHLWNDSYFKQKATEPLWDEKPVISSDFRLKLFFGVLGIAADFEHWKWFHVGTPNNNNNPSE